MSGVWLVGAGPGDPGLITVRGLEPLRRCDAVVFDRLVAPELVDEAPAEALRIGREPLARRRSTGCSCGWPRGLEVVRLKGGDPFLFGRGGEEALALVEAGVPFEVVPGVSSLAAVPAAAGIPVTHRGRIVAGDDRERPRPPSTSPRSRPRRHAGRLHGARRGSTSWRRD